MENINGIQVDMSAILGDKIAEMAIATIPKEKLEEIGTAALKEVITKKGSGWNQEPAKAEKIASEKFYAEVSKYFDELVSSEEYKKKAKEEAERIVEEMKQKIHDNLVNSVSSQLSAMSVDPYGNIFRQNVAQIVASMTQQRY
jgi:HD-GYP domain-containing protein (c-di-GMP phosphodiesterase class II)